MKHQLGEYIKCARNREGKSLAHVAHVIKISPITFDRIEKGEVGFTGLYLSQINLLAKELRVSSIKLLSLAEAYEEEKENP